MLGFLGLSAPLALSQSVIALMYVFGVVSYEMAENSRIGLSSSR